MSTWMSTDDAAQALGVSRDTVYAYASRGLLTPERGAVRGRRGSRYRRDEVERLAAAHARARRPRQAAQAALDFGLPVLASSLTLVRDGRLYYASQEAAHDAVALSAHACLEDVAALLWRQPWPAQVAEPAAALSLTAARRQAPRPQRGWRQLAALLAAERDADLPPASLVQAVRAATTLRRPPAALTGAPMHRQLQALWRLDEASAQTLRAALVLSADHELNASSFVARGTASTGATLAASVLAALGALSGPRHGGATAAVEAAWDGWMARGRTPQARALAALAQPQPGCTPMGLGFGHPLYPQGDPRAQALLARLPRDAARERWLLAVREHTGLAPSLDFALVAVRRALGLPEGVAFALFAIGRSVGWIAHALEQQATGALIRPRAHYTGPQPEPASAPAPAPVGRVHRLRG